jgi:4-alpha-glucanotransferase
MKLKRGSGILLHITSLPGPEGIGGLGPNAFAFVDFLAKAGQQYWQFLPIGPCSRAFGMSPYMSLSAFAGNPLMISMSKLYGQGLLRRWAPQSDFSEYLVDYDAVLKFKHPLLKEACQTYFDGEDTEGFEKFCSQQNWLDEYALYMALREKFNKKSWTAWPRKFAARHPEALRKARRELADRIRYHKFVQYCFFSQWFELKRHANQQGIRLIGDIPIYVGLDSVDVWAFQENYLLDKQKLTPTHVAGVPPDYFSTTGQRWGNPIYRWKLDDGKDNEPLYAWWRQRFLCKFQIADIIRIDHFRGFEAHWQIPAAEKTAINGEWVKGPGIGFFMKIARNIGSLQIIAEDLGVVTPEVEELRDRLQYPGMKILQFAFDSNADNAYLPHNYTTTNCVVYSGTHDNDTTVGWYLSDRVNSLGKERARRYAHSDGNEIHWDFIRLAYSSIADIAIIPLQDALGFGSDCRMNTPSTSEGNWRWRCAGRFLQGGLAARLYDETAFYGRLPKSLNSEDQD